MKLEDFTRFDRLTEAHCRIKSECDKAELSTAVVAKHKVCIGEASLSKTLHFHPEHHCRRPPPQPYFPDSCPPFNVTGRHSSLARRRHNVLLPLWVVFGRGIQLLCCPNATVSTLLSSPGVSLSVIVLMVWPLVISIGELVVGWTDQRMRVFTCCQWPPGYGNF